MLNSGLAENGGSGVTHKHQASMGVRPLRKRHNRWAFSLALAFLSLAVFWPVAGFDFVNYDDPVYVTKNPNVLNGLTWEGAQWAFESHGYASNWHPLTWLSHMLDVELFGLNAGWHHLMNAIFHTVSSVLLYSALNAATGAVWASAITAGLFAVHPLHVESVAWVSERKDVLSAMFWMSGLLAYVRYLRAPGVIRYIAVVAAFALGLMAKPMVITFPFVLLLMDYWPLGRFARARSLSGRGGGLAPSRFRPVVEKVPFFVLSAAAGVITYLAQGQGGAMSFQHGQHLDLRLANVSLAYVHYLVKAAWPLELSVYYPYNFGWPPVWKVTGAVVILVALTALAFLWRRRRPHLLTGWLWFVGALVPVIGFVQIGTQALADRYTYLPLIGLFLMVSFGIPALRTHPERTRIVAWAALGCALCVLVSLSSIQLGYWRDSGSLFAHAVELNPKDNKARDNLGSFLLDNGRLDEALEQFSRSIEIKPLDYVAWFNTGLALCRQGNAAGARLCFRKAIGIHPAFSRFYENLGRPCAE